MFSKPNMTNKELDDSLKNAESKVNNAKSMASQMQRKLEELKRLNDAINSNATNRAALLTPKSTAPADNTEQPAATQDKSKSNTR